MNCKNALIAFFREYDSIFLERSRKSAKGLRTVDVLAENRTGNFPNECQDRYRWNISI
jgi:hypothetical protein